MTAPTDSRADSRADPGPADSGPLSVSWAIALLPPLFWSGNFLVGRLMHTTIPPIQMSFWRWAGAFAILAPFAARSFWQHRARLRRELPFLIVVGGVGIAAYNSLLYSALRFTTLVNAALINALIPVSTFVLAALFLREKPTRRQMAGIAVAYIGAAALIGRGRPAILRLLDFNPGDLLALAAMVFFSLYTVLIRWRPTQLPPVLFLVAVVGIGIVLHLPLLAWEIPGTGLFTPDAASITALLYLAVFPSTLAYILWNRTAAALGPARTGMFLYLLPVFSTAFGIVLLGEPFHLYHAFGSVLVVIGVVLVTRAAAVSRR